MFDKFYLFASALGSEKRYKNRISKYTAPKFDEVESEIQNFRAFLSFILVKNQTRVTEGETLFRATAKHTEMRDEFSNKARNYPLS